MSTHDKTVSRRRAPLFGGVIAAVLLIGLAWAVLPSLEAQTEVAAPTLAELSDLRAQEEALLVGAEALEDDRYRIPIEAAKQALVDDPDLLFSAFSKPAAAVSLDPLAAEGKALFASKICFTCHSTDGSPLIGPTMKDLFGREQEMIDGTKLTVDEAHVRESILEPLAKTAVNFIPGTMPAVIGGATDHELDALVAYLKTFSPAAFPPEEPAAPEGDAALMEQGKALFQSKICFTCHSTDGTRLVGPTFKGLLGRTEELDDGTTITVDDGYIRESIADPNAKAVVTYPKGAMPPVLGGITDAEMDALIVYITSFE